jgi:hypothetical protein
MVTYQTEIDIGLARSKITDPQSNMHEQNCIPGFEVLGMVQVGNCASS